MRQGYRDAEGHAKGGPPRGRQGPGCRPRAAKGGANRHGNSSRRRHAARGSGTSGGGWRVRAASSWAALCTGRGGGVRVKIERASKRNGYGWGGGRKEGEKNDPENGRRKRWGGRARLKSNKKRRILGPEWSMSEVGTPTPHNSDKPHGLVDSINNNNNKPIFSEDSVPSSVHRIKGRAVESTRTPCCHLVGFHARTPVALLLLPFPC